jgi:hypothetical protein
MVNKHELSGKPFEWAYGKHYIGLVINRLNGHALFFYILRRSSRMQASLLGRTLFQDFEKCSDFILMFPYII